LKIVDVTEFYSERGGGVRSHLTIRGHFLCQLGHDHVVIAPGPRDEDALLCASAAPGRARVVRLAGPALPYDHTYHLLGRFDKVRRRVREEAPDVLEAHSPYLGAAAVVACGRRTSQIRTAFWHADHLGTYVEPALAAALGPRLGQVVAEPLRVGVRALLAPFEATFAASRTQAERLRTAGVPNVVLAPFGVDVETFTPSARRQASRHEWLEGADPHAILLVGVGRFAFEKRWDVVLDAFARVRKQRPAVLVLFGDGPERERLQLMAPPGVRFPGFEKDRRRLAAALASADVLVHGCPYETFGLGVAEAVACGLPVVVPDAGGARESVDAACGEVYESLDAEACATAIERLLARDPCELRLRALEAAGRVPTLAQHFEQVLATYADLRHDRAGGAAGDTPPRARAAAVREIGDRCHGNDLP
jgi:alpha-1,6-mannosyltransferase